MYKKTDADKILESLARLEDGAKKNYLNLFPEEQIQGILDAFIINKPMTGSVGGDGFWVHQDSENLYLAVFDCMDHGHLASVMTRVYTNSFKKVVDEQGIHDPGEILKQLHQEIQNKFENKENRQVGSGADVGLVKIGISEMRMEFAGAKMDLLKVVDQEVDTIKADKLQIGEMFEYEHTYKTQNLPIDLSKRTNYYLSSDGFRDLVGGPDNKKLGKKKMFELLSDYYKLSMKAQKTVFTNFIKDWSGSVEPLDDVLIIGFSM